MIERFNRTIGECIVKLQTDKEKEWDEYIDAILLAYRTMKHEATGFTPFQLLYGRQAKLPVDLKITTYKKTPVNYDEALIRRTYEIINKMNNEQIKARENIEKGQELYMKLKLNHFEGRNGRNRVEMFRPKTS